MSDNNLENAKRHIENFIYHMRKEYGTQITVYPQVNYDIKFNRYQIEFLVDQRKCDIFQLLMTALNVYQAKFDKDTFKIKDIDTMKSGEILTFICNFEEPIGNPKSKISSKGTIYISGEMTNERPNFKFTMEKTEQFTSTDLESFCAVYKEANRPQTIIRQRQYKTQSTQDNGSKSFFSTQKPQEESRNEHLQKLENAGVIVFVPDNKQNSEGLDWDFLAGYEAQKRDIEDTVLLALVHPEIFDKITQGTRMKVQPNRPKAILFEGPPGTGKTTSAKIIASQVKKYQRQIKIQVNIPLIYLPLESITSKWYGESEKKFSEIWDSAKNLGKSIIFIDEIDALANQRGESMHEASRRILSTLLRKIDSFESTTEVLLICATNRKSDLDQAMLSRIDMSIKFELPDRISRSAIFQRYAKQLDKTQLQKLADLSDNMSGRNIADICKDAERRWASKLIRNEVSSDLPDLNQYIEALNSRKEQNLA